MPTSSQALILHVSHGPLPPIRPRRQCWQAEGTDDYEWPDIPTIPAPVRIQVKAEEKKRPICIKSKSKHRLKSRPNLKRHRAIFEYRMDMTSLPQLLKIRGLHGSQQLSMAGTTVSWKVNSIGPFYERLSQSPPRLALRRNLAAIGMPGQTDGFVYRDGQSDNPTPRFAYTHANYLRTDLAPASDLNWSVGHTQHMSKGLTSFIKLDIEDGVRKMKEADSRNANFFQVIHVGEDTTTGRSTYRLQKCHPQDAGSFRLLSTGVNEVGDFKLAAHPGSIIDDFRLVETRLGDMSFFIMKADREKGSFKAVKQSLTESGHHTASEPLFNPPQRMATESDYIHMVYDGNPPSMEDPHGDISLPRLPRQAWDVHLPMAYDQRHAHRLEDGPYTYNPGASESIGHGSHGKHDLEDGKPSTLTSRTHVATTTDTRYRWLDSNEQLTEEGRRNNQTSKITKHHLLQHVAAHDNGRSAFDGNMYAGHDGNEACVEHTKESGNLYSTDSAIGAYAYDRPRQHGAGARSGKEVTDSRYGQQSDVRQDITRQPNQRSRPSDGSGTAYDSAYAEMASRVYGGMPQATRTGNAPHDDMTEHLCNPTHGQAYDSSDAYKQLVNLDGTPGAAYSKPGPGANTGNVYRASKDSPLTSNMSRRSTDWTGHHFDHWSRTTHAADGIEAALGEPDNRMLMHQRQDDAHRGGFQQMSRVDDNKLKADFKQLKKKRITAVRIRKELPPEEPNAVCVRLPVDNAIPHSRLKKMVESESGFKLTSLQFDPVSVHSTDSEAKSQWILRFDEASICAELITSGLIINGVQCRVRSFNDVMKEEHDAYKFYEIIKELDQRVVRKQKPRNKSKSTCAETQTTMANAKIKQL